MNILYIHQYFVTPSEPGGTRSYWISQELIRQGHKVTMLTTKSDKTKPESNNIDGINMIYLDVFYSSHMSIFNRLMSFMKFMTLSSIIVLKEKKYDLIIATSTPLSIGFPALIGKIFKNIPYVFEVRDLWPEVPIQMGAIKNIYIIKLLKWFEKYIYRKSIHIVSLSPGMYDGVISTGISTNKVSMIPNMSKIDLFWPRSKNISLVQELKVNPNTFKIIYFGAMGIANGIDYIIDSAKQLLQQKDIEFLFFGYGSKELAIKERCINENITNITFFKGVSMERLSEIVNFCDISLVTFANLPILATNSPNKLFDSLSAGKPIIVNSAGWTKKMVEEYNCGFFVDPTNPEDLVNKIIILKNDPKLCEEMGMNSRRLAQEKYDKSILCVQYAEIINSLSI